MDGRALPALLALTLAAAAHAADEPVRITFQKGELCSTYSGRAVSFLIFLKARQTALITAAGEAGEYEPATSLTDVLIKPHSIYLARGQDRRSIVPAADGRYAIPLDGDYIIELGPHYMQGGQGLLSICVR